MFLVFSSIYPQNETGNNRNYQEYNEIILLKCCMISLYWKVTFIISYYKVVCYDLTDFTCEFFILIVNHIIIRTCAIHSSTLLSLVCRWWFKISPSIPLTVYTGCVCQIMRSNGIWCITVTSENRHIWTIRKLNIITVIVLELYIIKECFRIERLFWVYLIKQ